MPALGQGDHLCWQGEGQARTALTIVLALDKGLPLPKPLHADAVDDAGALLRLERLVQLGRGEQRGASHHYPGTPPTPPPTPRKPQILQAANGGGPPPLNWAR